MQACWKCRGHSRENSMQEINEKKNESDAAILDGVILLEPKPVHFELINLYCNSCF